MLSTDRRKQYAWGLIGLLSAFLIVVSVYAIQATNDAMRTVESCTTPQGACFKKQQQRTQTLVATSRTITVAVAECARDPRVTDIRRCVDRKLADVDLTAALGGKP